MHPLDSDARIRDNGSRFTAGECNENWNYRLFVGVCIGGYTRAASVSKEPRSSSVADEPRQVSALRAADALFAILQVHGRRAHH